MRIAKVFDGLVVELDEASVMFPNTSFTETGPNDEFLVENNCMRVVDDIPFDNASQKIIDVAPYVLMGAVYTRMAVLLTEEETATRLADAWVAVRNLRDQKLRASDFSLLPDSPYNEEQRAVWIAYRSTLRNIPQTQTDPTNIVWPDRPFPPV